MLLYASIVNAVHSLEGCFVFVASVEISDQIIVLHCIFTNALHTDSESKRPVLPLPATAAAWIAD